ncbi:MULTISPECIES: N-6 DNA methylase [unclassified Microcystis]|jgi:type I restriction enzyme M protein|uniref:DNA methylase n=3 Tax=Microcystis TaxID=1125 RepID=A0A552L6N1_9CHRO|nr:MULTISPECIES: N-6 DNA methylase [unclassified Microcystis]MCA2817417.1 N-6 DNA methylase [Microcystis sp. M085S1]MCA2856287.1 N-6 DNA methylase [Microcystis sp. M065S1]TRT75791.1 MAG: DNA methylase [Microcystis flos-aquae Ma_QC_C_20070823_S18]TRT96352.1 MAG: DNA methylase [Microcystis flos-aquae Ma_QC_C_20070823_S18D]TRV15885.1 MAG: DNA methylase [Microcystis flos-aquae Mf_QC_C_20070823_S10D]TRV25524.1 MAG: DNA methylase [Microcystis flos-aquae Mf_QC_C_20070823_S10]TRV33439.1 MAG: DNA met
MKLADILKDSSYKLSQFTPTEIEQLEQTITLKKTKNGEAPYTICLVRKKEIKLTPEEAIRQLYLRVLSDRLNYPLSRIQVEYGVNFGREVKRADIAVMDKDRLNTVYILVEVKSPKWKDGKAQLRSYCNATGSPMAVWTNGDQISYYQRKDPNYFEDIPDIPNSNQTLADILQIKFTLDDLIAKDKLVKENKSLKTLIEEMEDEVLANAGVDVFEELFKLIFAKLYDEWYSGQGNRRRTRLLEFRNTGQTEAALKNKIQDLFDRAKKKWPGIFSEDVKIGLAPSHLSVCVSSLENVKLFNSNLDVIDEAFEYLINQSSKGEKGQFFTPRYVIDMCVKMLNPQEDEYMIDSAAGSSGFPVHTIFHVWRQILEDEGLEVSHLFSLEEKPPRCKEYVEEKVFAIDFDEKAVRVARTLNLIAGDGQTNVLHLNTLDYELWDEVTQQEEWDDVYHEGFRRLKKLRPKGSPDYREFQFDILMANPPFAGDIKEQRMIARYDLAKKPNGKWETKVGRDILFIERNLDFLKPGGRMAIVLPQGRFNNSSDKNIRDFIAERCRILAVVGLHGNTFKPHTGTKTSVLLVQKWNDDPKIGALCPRQDDYNIFFATMQKSGKDNSGEKVYVKGSDDSGDFLLDKHNHWIVDHDLFNHDGLTEDGIAEAFIEFAKKENLSFFDLSPLSKGGAFDAVKYQQLMDRLEISEVSFQKVMKESYSSRIDSTFFYKEFLQSILNNTESWLLSKICTIRSGTTPPDRDENLAEGVILLKTNDIRNNVLTNNNIENYFFIDEVINTRMKNTQLQAEDILINIVGATTDVIGRVAFISDNFPKANITQAMSLLRIKDKNLVDPYYLFVFLSSFYGNQQVRRIARPTGQYNMNLVEVGSIKLPIINFHFQKKIKNLVFECGVLLEMSKNIYSDAENLLLTELGLKDWQPTEESIAVKSFSESFLSSGRLDAEYYQPKFYQVENKIKANGFVLVEDICSLVNYGSVPTSPYTETDEGVPYIKGLNLKNTEIITTQLDRIINTENLPSKVYTKQGDIVISQMGTVGNCGVVEDEQVGWIFASFTIRIRIKDQSKFNPYFVALYIEKVAKEYYLMRNIAQASVRQNTDLPTIKNMYIPLISKDTQLSIAEKMLSAKKTKQKSKQLLEIAKIGVEKAIETDEETAADWINQQLESLGVNLI